MPFSPTYLSPKRLCERVKRARQSNVIIYTVDEILNSDDRIQSRNFMLQDDVKKLKFVVWGVHPTMHPPKASTNDGAVKTAPYSSKPVLYCKF